MASCPRQCTPVQCLLPCLQTAAGSGKPGGHRRPPSTSRLGTAPATAAKGASPGAAVAAKRRSSKAAAPDPSPKRQRRAEEAGAAAETGEAPEAAALAIKATKTAKQKSGPKGSNLGGGAYGEAARYLKELQKKGLAAVVPQWDKMDAACSGFDEQVGQSALSKCLHPS